MSDVAVFTIASKNYLSYVRVLFSSLGAHHPEYKPYLVLADRLDACFDPKQEPFEIVEAQQIGIPDFSDMTIRYDIMELNTAIKPFAFEWLFQHSSAEAVIYLDPDIQVFSTFDKLYAALQAGASVVLTPHICKPLEDGKTPSDFNMLQAGVFNLGFMAGRDCPETRNFVSWWGRQLRTKACADFHNSMFTDQRWCDLAPCFLEHLTVLKDPGFNVAYWNLTERELVTNGNGTWHVNGRPLVFFHFSGINVNEPDVLSKHQNRFDFDALPHLRPLFGAYRDALVQASWPETKNWPYAYESVDGLGKIAPIVRQHYRITNPSPQSLGSHELGTTLLRLCNDPDVNLLGSTGEQPISRLMHTIYKGREDLRLAFDLGTRAGREAFIQWFFERAEREYGLPGSVIAVSARSASVSGVQARSRVEAQQSMWKKEITRMIRSGIHSLTSVGKLATSSFGKHASSHSPPQRTSENTSKNGPIAYRALCMLDNSSLRAVWCRLPDKYRDQTKRLWLTLLERTLNHGRAPDDSARRHDLLRLPAEIEQLSVSFLITKLMHMIWTARPDLQSAFDLQTAASQEAFIDWYRSSSLREYGIAPSIPMRDEVFPRSMSTRPKPLGRPGANLIGYAHAELGMGEHVRMTSTALYAVNAPYGVVNFNIGVASRQMATLEHGELVEHNLHVANVFHINADQMLMAYCRLGPDFFANRYNIAYWAWELSECPNEWLAVMDMVDEIWAPSQFIQQAFSAPAKVPVVHMPLCVSLPPIPQFDREHFGLPNDAFVFLYTFDFLSFMERKNPFDVIRAFRRAFKENQRDVMLVLKTMNGKESSSSWKAMLELIDFDPRIRVINQTMERDEVLGLLQVSNCFVSLHRSEGFGRGPVEAMYLGKPVIVTNYSGNIDFTLSDNSCLVDYNLIPVRAGDYPFHEDQVWAQPDVEHASWYMQRVYADTAYCQDIGSRASEHIRKHFNPQSIGGRYVRRLRDLGFC